MSSTKMMRPRDVTGTTNIRFSERPLKLSAHATDTAESTGTEPNQ